MRLPQARHPNLLALMPLADVVPSAHRAQRQETCHANSEPANIAMRWQLIVRVHETNSSRLHEPNRYNAACSNYRQKWMIANICRAAATFVGDVAKKREMKVSRTKTGYVLNP